MRNCPSRHAANGPDAEFCGNCGKRIAGAVPAAGIVVVGRDESCGYIADKPMVSGRHCQLSFLTDQIEVTDLGSSNGTFVGCDRRRVAAPVQIGSADPVFLGSFQLPLAEIARSIGVQWPPLGKSAAARTVLEEAEPIPSAPAKVAFAAERAELERERQRLQAEREASERMRGANSASAWEAERAASRVAEAAARLQTEHARAMAEVRNAAPIPDQRSGFEKGANAAGAVAGFGIGCVMWVVCVLIILGIIGAILMKHH